MANLLIEEMDDDLYAQLNFMSASENRTISQQILFILKKYLATRHQLKGPIRPPMYYLIYPALGKMIARRNKL